MTSITQFVEFSTALALVSDVVLIDRWLPERVVTDAFEVATFFDSGTLFRVPEFAEGFKQMLLSFGHDLEYLVVPIPQENTKISFAPGIAVFPGSLPPDMVQDELSSVDSEITTPWSCFSRYVILPTRRDWVVYGDNTLGLAFLAFARSCSELSVRRATREFERSGDCIGDLNSLLRNDGIRAIVGGAKWSGWSDRMSTAYRKNRSIGAPKGDASKRGGGN